MELKLNIINYGAFARRPLLTKDEWEPWQKALLSGEFDQGKSDLCNNKKYCCLGVLCVVQNRIRTKEEGRTFFDGQGSWLACNNPLFEKLSSSGNFIGFYLSTYDDRWFHSLAALNDAGFSFVEISEVIEKYLVAA